MAQCACGVLNHFGPNKPSKHFGFIGQYISETLRKAVFKRAAKDRRKKQLLHQSADPSGPEHWIVPRHKCEVFQYDIEQLVYNSAIFCTYIAQIQYI